MQVNAGSERGKEQLSPFPSPESSFCRCCRIGRLVVWSPIYELAARPHSGPASLDRTPIFLNEGGRMKPNLLIGILLIAVASPVASGQTPCPAADQSPCVLSQQELPGIKSGQD